MRYATVLIRWDDTEMMPITSAIAADTDVHLEETYFINPIGNGTYVELRRFGGDMARAAELLDSCSQVTQFRIPDSNDGFVYLQYESAPLLDEIIALLSEYAVVISWPIRFTRDALGMELTVLGPKSVLDAFIAAFPEDITLELVRTGDYHASIPDPIERMTDRQRTVLDIAVREGYFESPRQATLRDLAEELNIAPGTIAEHLQRIESTVMRSLTNPT